MPDCTAGLRLRTLVAITVINVPPLRGESSAIAPVARTAAAAVAVTIPLSICFIILNLPYSYMFLRHCDEPRPRFFLQKTD